MKINKKKAFTLTELLVVVVVMGILSAVVLPKFSKVMETRKTTEAEGVMAAIRTEQERRCALDKPYLTDLSKMNDVVDLSKMNDVVDALNSKNFVYAKNTNAGIEARSKKKHYVLKMKSYADGGICCDGDGVGNDCAYLNKEYPSCSTYTPKPSPESCIDETSIDETSVPPVPPVPPSDPCPGSPETSTVACNTCGTKTRTQYCDLSTGTWKWNDWGACSVSDPNTCEYECTTPKPADVKQTCNECGEKTASYSCDKTKGEWTLGSYGACSVSSPSECEPDCEAKNECTEIDRWEWEDGNDTCDKDKNNAFFSPIAVVNFGGNCTDFYVKRIGTSSTGKDGGCNTTPPPCDLSKGLFPVCRYGEWKCERPVQGGNGVNNMEGGDPNITNPYSPDLGQVNATLDTYYKCEVVVCGKISLTPWGEGTQVKHEF